MSIIKHVTLQKIVAHDFRYDPRILKPRKGVQKSGGGDGTGVFAHSVYCYCILRQLLLTSFRSTRISDRKLVVMTTVISVNRMNE